ncbi:response regulator [Rhodocaloribacter litoris]|uniref:ATP-binding protein n=1 Tax=Rhodocaloribacter litoris TaxID=2558931 RepID=UPI00141DFF2B|nr:ATP-binding protein [Rhodocaloribacter litoris]QXD16272.1 response regulator [Rhodocaloribacter litoris]
MAVPSVFSAESGRPFRLHFTPDEHGGHAQTWSLVQDDRGLIYVGNNHRVLEYDGVAWRHIPIPNESIARGLALDDHGTVFVGAQDEVGYLAAGRDGVTRYVSLLDALPPEDRAFGDVWRVVVLSDGVYFQSTRQIMRWDGRPPMRVWRTATRFRPATAVRDTLFVSEDGRGLLALAGDTLALVPGGEVFAARPVYAVLPLPGGGLVVGTASDGLFRRSGGAFVPMPTGADDALRNGFLYTGVVLPGGPLAFGTIRRGGVVLAPDGRLLRRLDPSTGVPEDPILNLAVDREGALWVVQDGGLVRLETNNPMTVFDEALGIGGTVEAVARHRGRLYAATREGLRRLEPGPAGIPRFAPVPGFDGQIWDLVDAGETLLVASAGGVYALRDGRAERLLTAGHAYTLYPDPGRPGRVWAGLGDGLAVLERRAGRWVAAGRVEGVTEEVRSLARTGARTLWLGTSYQGLVEVVFPGDETAPPAVYRYGLADGLPEGRIYLFQVAGVWKAGTLQGLFDFRSEPGPDGTRRLVLAPDTVLAPALGNPARDFFRMAEDAAGHVWARLDGETGVFLRQPDGRYRWVWDRTPLRRISQSTFSFFPEHDGVVWIGRSKDLIRYDTRPAFTPTVPGAVVLRRVAPADRDTLLYDGGRVDGRPVPVLPYAMRNLRFTYALPFFDAPDATRFQVRLVGFEEQWSAWSAETYRDYTNLPEGSYRFLVRARDVYGRISEATTFAFTIHPPWHRTAWAYLGYLLGVLGLVYAGARWQQRRHRARERELERQVRERTAEVARQRDQLERQAVRLAELDRLKSRFFANVTHEFRTPLTLTLGPLEDLLDGDTLRDEDAEQVRLSLRNARRLLRLINQILDVSRLEAGRMRLQAREGDLAAYVYELAQAFLPLAERKGVALLVDVPPEPVLVYFDHDQLEKVIGNLLSNAFKFTPEGGTVRVTVNADAEAAEVQVSDTGPGIAPEDLDHIFDRFYRADESTAHRQPGTGIGLALVKELVELHGGTIRAESTVGEGTTFRVRLPRGSDHLHPEQRAGMDPCDEGFDENAEERLVRYADLPPEHPAGDGPEPPEDPEETPREDRPLVLVADDNAELRAFVRRHLEPDYRVVEAGDGAAALDLAREAVPDLIVSDVMMPSLDGDALCHAVKTDPDLDFVPVILLTARASMEGRLQGLEKGADDYLTKPFAMPELRARIANLIAQRRRLKARWQGDGLRLQATVPEVTSADEAFLRSVLEAVEAEMEDETFSVARLAGAVGQSRANLHRRLKQLTGKTPSEWIMALRLERAAALLAGGAGTVSEVAYGVGFKSVSYFCKCFRERYGTTPARYRETLGDETGR